MATVVQYRYVGFSWEAKPTTTPDGVSALPAGSLFAEQDTGLESVWNGSGWLPRPRPPAGDPDAPARLRREVRELRRVFCLAAGQAFIDDPS